MSKKREVIVLVEYEVSEFRFEGIPFFMFGALRSVTVVHVSGFKHVSKQILVGPK